MIPASFIEEVQSKTDIVELISSCIPLKRAGRNFKALCPFHEEKTPSFYVSSQKQIFHCFGCGKGGGAIQFIMLYERVSFPEAVEILAKRLGIEVPYQKGSPNSKLKPLLYDVVYEASMFFHRNLFEHPEGKYAQQYLANRGLSQEIVKQFRLGYAPGKNQLIEYMRKKGVSLEIMEKASLATAKQEGGYTDLFWNRVVFPIFDVRSRVVGFGARTLREKEGIPKYINSVENPLYSKREHLFGLNFSKEDIIKNDCVIVVEGYFDMLTPYAKGIKNIVASLGTSLTAEQIRIIKRYTNNVILIFDSDKAGESASFRAIDLLLENSLKVSIVEMPVGFDPDLAVRERGKEFFLHCLDRRLDFFDYKIDVLKNRYGVNTIEGKTKLAGEMLSTLQKLKSEVERYEYLRRLSAVLAVKEEVLFAELKRINKIKDSGSLRDSVLTNSIDKLPIPIQERTVLKFMLTHKKGLEIIKKKLVEDDFTHPLVRKTVGFLFNYSQAKDEERAFLKNFLGLVEDKEISGFVSRLLMEEDEVLNKDFLKKCIVKLQKNRIKMVKENLKKEIKKAEESGDEERLKELVGKYKNLERKVKYG